MQLVYGCHSGVKAFSVFHQADNHFPIHAFKQQRPRDEDLRLAGVLVPLPSMRSPLMEGPDHKGEGFFSPLRLLRGGNAACKPQGEQQPPRRLGMRAEPPPIQIPAQILRYKPAVCVACASQRTVSRTRTGPVVDMTATVSDRRHLSCLTALKNQAHHNNGK